MKDRIIGYFIFGAMLVFGLLGSLWLTIMGGIGLISMAAEDYEKISKNNKNKKFHQKVMKQVLAAFGRQKQVQLSEHVTLRRRGEIEDLRDVQVCYDGAYVATLADFEKEEGHQEVLKMLAKREFDIIQEEVDFIDENNNGIDDREETRAPYFAKLLSPYLNQFEKPSITAGLKEIITLLFDIDQIERKYPDEAGCFDRLYKQYLPLLMNILPQYQTLKDKGASEQELVVIENKLEKTLFLVNEAMQSLMSDIAASDVLNMKSDMSVLQSLLKRDGLVQEGQMGGTNNGTKQ